MAVKVNPRKLRGPWTDGFALDLHTTESTFLGYNAYGHPEFDTKHSPLGDLLYRLKNRGDRTAIEPIAEGALGFLQKWNPKVDAIVPVPPSNTQRKNQPVLEVANVLSAQSGIPLCSFCISKVKSTAQLKDVFDQSKRAAMLADAFSVDRAKTAGKRLLLFDDLFRSGATADTLARLLIGPGGSSAVYLLTLTQTRRNL
jgi:competence protein ComFC